DDPMWRMPLYRPYRRMIDSKVADMNNVSDGPHAGAITAALYLQEFVDPKVPWAHLDVMAWNQRSRPAVPKAPRRRLCARSTRTSPTGLGDGITRGGSRHSGRRAVRWRSASATPPAPARS